MWGCRKGRMSGNQIFQHTSMDKDGACLCTGLTLYHFFVACKTDFLLLPPLPLHWLLSCCYDKTSWPEETYRKMRLLGLMVLKGESIMASGGLASSSRHGAGAGESIARWGRELSKPIPNVGLPSARLHISSNGPTDREPRSEHRSLWETFLSNHHSPLLISHFSWPLHLLTLCFHKV